MSAARTDRIIPIQALRLLAALAVVVGHAQIFAYWLGQQLGDTVPETPITFPGGAGVDLFFVISGFVMVHSSQALFGAEGARTTFLRRRIIRIVPLYWLAMAVLLAWSWRFAEVPSPGSLAADFAFIPHASAQANGDAVPFLEVGWTLNYEMFFYCAFALCLLGSARKTVASLTAALVLLVLAGSLLALPQPMAFWTQPILLEFIAGMGLALLHRNDLQLHAFLRAILVVAALMALQWTHSGEGISLTGWDRVLAWGIPGVALLAAAVLGPLRLPAGRLWNFGGDISYALYLWHMPLMIVARWFGRHFAIPYGETGQWIFIIGITIASLIAASAIHLAIEKPITRRLKAHFCRPVAKVG